MSRVLGFVLAVLVLSAPVPADGQHRDGDGNITMAKAGDLIITRALSVYEEPEFLKLRDLIRGASVGLGNMEMLLHDYGDDIIPAAQSGGTYMTGHPDLAHELEWMGFDMLGLANNHTMDWGVGGMRSTIEALSSAGIRTAGAGENLALARAPAYLETPDGRVALIAVSSSFADHMRAGHQRPDVRGRPGLAPIRFETTRIVPSEVYEQLEEVRSEVGGIGSSFQPGEGYRTVTTPHEGDLEELLAAVRDARRQANWVVVTSHTHQGDGNDYRPERAGDLPGCLGLYHDECGDAGRYVPADALVTFARAVIDAGADAFYAHGPHVVRGIEIYRGKPIFYSLGDFIFQNETPRFQPWDNFSAQGLGLDALPADFYDTRIESSTTGSFPGREWFWESFLALTEFREGELYEVRIVPVDIGFGRQGPEDRAIRGRPVAATGEQAQRVLRLVQALSEPFGTQIEIVGEEGVIRGPAAADGDGSGGRR